MLADMHDVDIRREWSQVVLAGDVHARDTVTRVVLSDLRSSEGCRCGAWCVMIIVECKEFSRMVLVGRSADWTMKLDKLVLA